MAQQAEAIYSYRILLSTKTYDNQGYGTKLMCMAEDEARKRGCHAAHLGTYSFQALPFYQKLVLYDLWHPR